MKSLKFLKKLGSSGVANIVLGSGSTVGTAIVEHPDVHVISFTGSNEVGRHIAEKGGSNLKKVSLKWVGKMPSS